MSRDERERLRDIVEASEAIRDDVGGSLEEPTISGPVVLAGLRDIIAHEWRNLPRGRSFESSPI